MMSAVGPLLILAILALVGWAFLTRNRATAPPNAEGSTQRMPRISGPGIYAAEVVGESFYRTSFDALKRRHRPADDDDESFGDAILTLEDNNPHDPQAVSVELEGYQVGHLSRALAREFRQALKRDGFGQLKHVAVGARLYWGGEDGIYSVTLDLPEA